MKSDNNLLLILDQLRNPKLKTVSYYCDKHGQVEYQTFDFIEKKSCPLCEKEKESQINELRRLERIRNMGIRERHINANFEPTGKNQLANDYILKLKNIIETREFKNIVINGESGTGKTYLASAAVISYNGVYKTWEDIVDDFESCSYQSKTSKKDVFKKLFTISLLVIDNIERGVDNDFKKQTLTRICNERYENKLPTWLVGKFTNTWFLNFFDKETKERFTESGESFKFSWESYRNKNDQ